ncbi:MAG TPA: TatD family hydrolase [Thermomicrobiales bacterium]|nr:TatD family hydrolase [Thermomicrobiales bacterium]
MSERADRVQLGSKLLELVDTHCHLDDESYAKDIDRVLDDSRALGVSRWIVVGFAPGRWATTLDVVRGVAGMSHMLGVHPGHASEWSSAVAARLGSLVATTRPVAIGEIGIDLFRGETNISQQLSAFDAQLDLALDHGLPAVIHMRSAETEVLNLILSREALPHLVFHSFDGSARLRDVILERCFTIGFGGLATKGPAADLREVIKTIPLGQIVLETDAPYLTPRGVKGSRNVPGNIPIIAGFLAGLLNTSVPEVARVTTDNAERVFGLIRG